MRAQHCGRRRLGCGGVRRRLRGRPARTRELHRFPAQQAAAGSLPRTPSTRRRRGFVELDSTGAVLHVMMVYFEQSS
eukprot:6190173-Pleurochrysis_carterae.AAC.1